MTPLAIPGAIAATYIDVTIDQSLLGVLWLIEVTQKDSPQSENPG